MAEIVLGIGASHGPTIQSQPEDWLRPRTEGHGGPALRLRCCAGIGPRRRSSANWSLRCFKGATSPSSAPIEEMSSVLQETRTRRHRVRQQPTRRTSAGPHGAGVRHLHEPHGVQGWNVPDHQSSGRRKPAEPQQTFRQVEPYAICPELADRLMHCLIADGIDVASCFQSDPTAGIEGPFTFAYDMFLPDRSTPVVPFLAQPVPATSGDIGAVLHRGAVHPARHRILGQRHARCHHGVRGGSAIRSSTRSWTARSFEALQHKDVETPELSAAGAAQTAPPGTPEILNWVVLAVRRG